MALAVIAPAVLTMASARAQAESIPTETQLSVETSQATGHTVSTFTVHVAPSDAGKAAGVVTLVDGARQLGSAVLDEDGNAKIALSSLSPGTHSVHALFEGSAKDSSRGSRALDSSQSLETEVTAQATGIADFSVTATPTSLSVNQGNEVTSQLVLTPINGFSGYVTLSCAQLTPDSQCNFVPVNVFVGGTTSSISVLSILTYGPTGPNAQLHTGLHTGSRLAYACLLLGMVGLGLRGRRTWQRFGVVLIGIALAGVTMGSMTGCSQRYHYLNKQPEASTGTPLGASSFILEEQSISGTTVITHQTTLALTVKAPAA
jgi:hypothetical protein